MGLLFSGLIAQLVWWPWVFLALAAVCGICVVVGSWVIPACPPLGKVVVSSNYGCVVMGVWVIGAV